MMGTITLEVTEPACHLVVSSSVADRQSALEAELRTAQASRRDLDNFLKWVQEAETTVNLLADASQRENARQDSSLVGELRQQLQVCVGTTARLGVYAGSPDLSACEL